MPCFRLLLPTCFLVHSVEGWMTPMPIPTTQATKFARARIITNSGNNANDGSLTFDDEDCIDLCDLGDDTAALPAPPQPLQQEKKKKQPTKQEQELHAEKQRIRLEMHWEMEQTKEECDVQDASTCSDACSDCQGVGHTTCQFCMGAKHISLSEGNDVSCPVCDEQGKQVCQKCRGTGRIAPWTELADFNPHL